MLDVLDRFPLERIYRHQFIFRGAQRCNESGFEGALQIIGVFNYLMLAAFHIVRLTNDNLLILLKFCLNCLVEIEVLFVVIIFVLHILVDQVIGLLLDVVVSELVCDLFIIV